MKTIKVSGIIFMFMMLVSNVFAQGASTDKIYFGGGIGFNSLSGIDFSDGIGVQILAGYELPVKMTQGKLYAEVGYMDTGDVEVGAAVVPAPGPGPGFVIVSAERDFNGFWGNAVYDLPLQNNLSILLRAGLDVGDDDGFMFGAGLGFDLSTKMELRGEYVIRDNIDSLQANLIMRM